MTYLYHYLYQDLWSPVWPNWLAGIIAGAVAYFWKGKNWLKRHQEHQAKIADIHKHLGLK